jgi:ribosome recycling factor
MRVPMPALTEERRKDLTKVVRMPARRPRWLCATCAAMRTSTRRSCSRTRLWTEDDERRAQDDVQKLTDRDRGRDRQAGPRQGSRDLAV